MIHKISRKVTYLYYSVLLFHIFQRLLLLIFEGPILIYVSIECQFREKGHIIQILAYVNFEDDAFSEYYEKYVAVYECSRTLIKTEEQIESICV